MREKTSVTIKFLGRSVNQKDRIRMKAGNHLDTLCFVYTVTIGKKAHERTSAVYSSSEDSNFGKYC